MFYDIKSFNKLSNIMGILIISVLSTSVTCVLYLVYTWIKKFSNKFYGYYYYYYHHHHHIHHYIARVRY